MVPRDSGGYYILGHYAAYFSLSKVSVEFIIEWKGEDTYGPLMLVEKSVRVDLPDCVRHECYNDLRFNVVIDYKYKDTVIKGANKSLVDRGYEDSITIFIVEDNKVIPLYDCVGWVGGFY